MGMPNLRFNKGLTKKLVMAKVNSPLPPSTVLWHLDNENNGGYGTIYSSLFGKVIFALIKGKEIYKLVVFDKKGVYGIFLIDNIKEYLDTIPTDQLLTNEELEGHHFVEDMNKAPLTGIVIVEDDKIFIYQHKDN